MLGLRFAPPLWWVVGFRVLSVFMKGFGVEDQQLGAARTETVARPGECRRIGHATKLHSLKSHNTHEDPRLGGPVGTFETKIRPLRGFRALPFGGGGGDTMGEGGDTTRDHIHINIINYLQTDKISVRRVLSICVTSIWWLLCIQARQQIMHLSIGGPKQRREIVHLSFGPKSATNRTS